MFDRELLLADITKARVLEKKSSGVAQQGDWLRRCLSLLLEAGGYLCRVVLAVKQPVSFNSTDRD